MKTIRNPKTWLLMSVFLLGMWPAIAAADVIYVKDDASPVGDGTSWLTAYKYLQDALADAGTDDEIWVAAGIYKPDQDEGGSVTAGDQTATFQLENYVALYGGFAGTESSLEQGDWQTNETILSGDIGTQGVSGDNSYHVVTGSGTDATAVLDGFTITAGNANGGGYNNLGGGMFNNSGSPTVINCTFSGNSAGSGGGMVNNFSSSPTVTNCMFSGNTALMGATGNGFGGGMYNLSNSSPEITDCTFSGNSAGNSGGGMVNVSNSPTVSNCTFSDNSANNAGGGMENVRSSLTITDCTFTGNSADIMGGGMYNGNSSPTVTDCTFRENSANSGGGMFNTRSLSE